MRRLLLWLEDEAPAWRIPDAEVAALARDIPDLVVERARTDEEFLAKVGDAEIQRRLEALPPFEPKVKRGWLARYLHFVTSADTGAVFEI